MEHLAAHCASLEQRGGGAVASCGPRQWTSPPPLSAPPQSRPAAAAAAAAVWPILRRLPPPGQCAASPDSPEIMRPPKLVKKDLAQAPQGRPRHAPQGRAGAGDVPGPAALPPGAEVRALAEELKEVVQAALRDATGQLAEAVGPQVRTGMVNVQDTLRQQKVAFPGMQKELTRLASEVAKANKKCPCEELPEVRQQVADAAALHRETSIELTAWRAAQGSAPPPSPSMPFRSVGVRVWGGGAGHWYVAAIICARHA